MNKLLKDHLNELSNDNLRKVIADCYDVLEKRKKQKKTELIEAFKKAFYDLEEMGIEVSIECRCCGDDVPITFNELYID